MPRKAPQPAAPKADTPTHVPPVEIRKETHSEEFKDPVLPDMDGSVRGEAIVLTEQQRLDKDYLAALAFAEEPVTIIIEAPDEENPPRVVDCWCNGKGAEVMDATTGKWAELGCLPIGGEIITKRKYVEILARSRAELIRTEEVDARPKPGEDGWKLRRSLRRKASFSVIADPNPKGREWLHRLLSER